MQVPPHMEHDGEPLYEECVPYQTRRNSANFLTNDTVVKNKELAHNVPKISRSMLKFKELIGSGEFGDIYIAQLLQLSGDLLDDSSRGCDDVLHAKSLVAVKCLKSSQGRIAGEFSKVNTIKMPLHLS